MPLEAGIIAFEIVMALVGWAANKNEIDKANKRASRETWMRSIYQSIKDAYGVTSKQIDDQLEKLGLTFNQLTETARGSARLSRASQMYREFCKTYPNRVSKLRSIQNVISQGINKLSASEDRFASAIQSGKNVSDIEILGDVANTTHSINTELTPSTDIDRTNSIVTDLQKKQSEDEKQSEQKVKTLAYISGGPLGGLAHEAYNRKVAKAKEQAQKKGGTESEKVPQ